MCKPTFPIFTFVVIASFAFLQSPARAAENAAAGGGKQVPLKYEIPKAMFIGTPKNIKAAATLEPYSEKAKAPPLVPEGYINLSAKKKVTSSDSNPIIGELSLITDGDKDGSDGSFVELAPGKQWVQIDLEKAADISAVVIWHYHAEGRVYHSVVVQVSDDPEFSKDVKTVFNNDYANALGFGAGKNQEYIDDYRGKAVAVKDAKGGPVRGRYVRLHSNGNTSNDQNHYIEVEVYGKPAK
jgi:ribosomal protein L35AE/L33A